MLHGLACARVPRSSSATLRASPRLSTAGQLGLAVRSHRGFTSRMPKSRSRRKNRNQRRAPCRPTVPRSERLSEDFAVLHATDAAEARGDVLETLELIDRHLHDHGDLSFWRPARLRRLTQLEMFGPILPRWATSRWILDQAAQSLHPALRSPVHRALQVTLDLRGEPERPRTVDLDLKASISDHDWVYRQLLLYEYDALDRFLAHVATPDLMVGADRIHDWARTPMGAFQLVDGKSKTLRWLDLATGAHVESLNIGAAAILEQGSFVLGRLVPIEDGVMFETAPMKVREHLAQRVAEAPGDWVELLRAEAGRSAGEIDDEAYRHDFPMLSDVEVPVRLALLEGVPGSSAAPTSAWDLRDLLARQVRVVLRALDGKRTPSGLLSDPRAALGATLLEPAVFCELAERVGPSHTPELVRMEDSMPEPAAAVCRLLATRARAAA